MRFAVILFAMIPLTGFAAAGPFADPAVDVQAGVGFCSAKPGDGCKGPLMKYTNGSDPQPWAVGCNMGESRFCMWCAHTGRTTYYSVGSKVKLSDCDPR